MNATTERIKKGIEKTRIETAYRDALKKAEEAYTEFLRTQCGEVVDTSKADLTGRKARCCKDAPIVDSDRSLPFFEYRGYGSQFASALCMSCGKWLNAHNLRSECQDFKGGKPTETDGYYCGHGGWD